MQNPTDNSTATHVRLPQRERSALKTEQNKGKAAGRFLNTQAFRAMSGIEES